METSKATGFVSQRTVNMTYIVRIFMFVFLLLALFANDALIFTYQAIKDDSNLGDMATSFYNAMFIMPCIILFLVIVSFSVKLNVSLINLNILMVTTT